MSSRDCRDQMIKALSVCLSVIKNKNLFWFCQNQSNTNMIQYHSTQLNQEQTMETRAGPSHRQRSKPNHCASPQLGWFRMDILCKISFLIGHGDDDGSYATGPWLALSQHPSFWQLFQQHMVHTRSLLPYSCLWEGHMTGSIISNFIQYFSRSCKSHWNKNVFICIFIHLYIYIERERL